ncbi:MAG TPA: DUF917 domain-containing protein [Patescibacteria group bacterium]|nr:DUF917 domain-containing protein [Patescibacteria group bacterium]
MVKTWSIDPDEIAPLLEGLAVLGNGGGGSPDWGRQILENDLSRGRSWKIVDAEDIPDDWTVVTGGILASVKELAGLEFAEILQDWETQFLTMQALRLHEGLLGRKIDAFVPFEPGGLNSPLVLTVSARSEILAIDGDGLGRACPETQMTTFTGQGIGIPPMPLVDRRGRAIAVLDCEDSAFPDEIGRWVVSSGGGMGSNTCYAMTGRQLKDSVVPGTFSRSLEIGRALVKARAEDRDPVSAIATILAAESLFRGEITHLLEEDRLGFYVTKATLKGSGPNAGSTAEIVIKNEAMLLFIDGRPRAIFPDSIYMLEPSTGRGYMSVELRVGSPMSILGAPAHPRLRAAATSAKGATSLGPVRFGYGDLAYTPIENLR